MGRLLEPLSQLTATARIDWTNGAVGLKLDSCFWNVPVIGEKIMLRSYLQRCGAPLAACRLFGGFIFFLSLLLMGAASCTCPISVLAQEASGAASVESGSASTTIADLRALEQKIRTTLQRVVPCVVSVSGGSGVVVSEDGLVLTVAHVGNRAGRRVTLVFPDGREVTGKTLGNDAGVDSGMIKITDDGKWPYAEMGTSADLADGQWCLALGYPVTFPRGKPPAVRIGRVLQNRSTGIVTDCTIMGGDSGGPLFDIDGKVIGVGSRCDNRLTTNIHVPIDCYRRSWERLAGGNDFNSQTEDRAFLGVVLAEDSEIAKIGEVYEDSGAGKAGLEAGDVIVKFDGSSVDRGDQLAGLIQKRWPGYEVEVEVRRGEEIVNLKVTLGSP
jgi:serine protease Do